MATLRARPRHSTSARFRSYGPASRFAVSGRKSRARVADLALDLGEMVSTDRLIDDLWSGSPPQSAAHASLLSIRARGVGSHRG